MIALKAPEPAGADAAAPGVGRTARSQADWQIVLRGDAAQGPSTLPADRAAVQRLLDQLALLSAEQFKSDAPQELDLEHWGFNRPERDGHPDSAGGPPRAPPGAVPASPGAAASQMTLEIGRSTQRDPFAYARLKDALSVYSVDPEILRDTPGPPARGAIASCRRLPAAARIVGLEADGPRGQ